MKRKKAVSLPRLTVLSMSRKDLTAFVSSIEFMRSQVNNLADEVARLRDLVDRLTLSRRRRAPAPAAPLPSSAEVNGEGCNDED